MKTGDLFTKKSKVEERLTKGQGIVVIETQKGTMVWGEPKSMATSCHEVANTLVGAKQVYPDNPIAVVFKGEILCDYSPSSILCQGCYGLINSHRNAEEFH